MKLTDLLKDAVYDIVGYVLPGLITLPFIFLLIHNDFHYSSLYSIYYNIGNLKLLLQSFNFQLTYYIPIIIISYVVGIFLKYLGILLGKLFKCFLGKNFAYNSFFNFFRINENSSSPNLISILIDNTTSLIDNYEEFSKELPNVNTSNTTSNGNKSSNEKFKDLFNDSSFIKEYARTISRFNNHNNLTPKYIAKTNFFSSLSTIFLLEFVNAIISLILYGINLHAASQFTWVNLLFPFTTSLIFFLLFVFCFIEFIDHKNYQEKENFFFLLENHYKKNKLTSIDTNSTETTE